MNYRLRFIRTEWLPRTGDSFKLSIEYDLLEDKDYETISEEGNSTFRGTITIGISGSLQSIWGLTGLDLEKALVEYAKLHIREKIIEGNLAKEENKLLTIDNSPDLCPFDVVGKDYYRVFEYVISVPEENHKKPSNPQVSQEYNWDIFISHASEDKDSVAIPLCRLLEERGLRVWVDQYQITLGDSLRQKIDEGLSKSKYGVVIISEHFFAKSWTQKELGALFSLDSNREKSILPVWHRVDYDFVTRHSPTLANIHATTTDKGLKQVSDEVLRAVSSHHEKNADINGEQYTPNDKNLISTILKKLGKLNRGFLITIISGVIVALISLGIEYGLLLPNRPKDSILLTATLPPTPNETTEIKSNLSSTETQDNYTPVPSPETISVPTQNSKDLISDEIEKLVNEGWSILLYDDFEDHILSDQWTGVDCDYGLWSQENGHFQINIATEEDVIFGQCVLRPNIDLIKMKDELFIAYEFFVGETYSDSVFYGFFSSCDNDERNWLIAAGDNVSFRLELGNGKSDYRMIDYGGSADSDTPYHDVGFVKYQNEYVSAWPFGNESFTPAKCNIPLTSIRFGAGIREKGSANGWLDNIYILTR